MTKSLRVILYSLPHGHQTIINMTNIDDCDREFFENGDYVVSMEQLSNSAIVVYARPEDSDEEDEVMVINKDNKTCNEVMKQLRELCEKSFNG